jgi:crotonobetainyl-CoA:carnitine CoA-transferase CaiB-like acyl-CoA transferase
MNNSDKKLPLEGLRVVEFTHMVMGPTCGMVLADMGAEVIKVEPIEGDRTRHLLGSGAGFFPMFNRNKKSIQINLQSPEGAEMARQLCATADVVAENFKPGSMAKYGLDYASLSATNPKVIYASLKGFLPGPYDHRTALDEVVQMMGGLAYMTGRPGDPLRAGTSVASPGAGKRSSRRCLRTTCFWWASTCCSTPSPARRPSPCPTASRPGRCTTCSPSRTANKSFWPP